MKSAVLFFPAHHINYKCNYKRKKKSHLEFHNDGKKERKKQNIAASMSPQEIEKYVVVDNLLFYFMHPAQ